MRNAFRITIVLMMCRLMHQIHAFRVIVTQKRQTVHVAALEVNVTVNPASQVQNVRNVWLVTQVTIAPDVRAIRGEPCTVVNVNGIVNVR